MTQSRKSRAPRWQFSFKGELICLYKAQWEALLLLGPQWLLIKRSAILLATRTALLKRGWAEFKPVAGHLMGRLTRAGLSVRDSVHIREAERTNKALWTAEGIRRRVPLDRKKPIPTTR